jgi:HEPN domain-containing protein
MKKYKREDGYLEEDLLQSSLHHLDAASILFKSGPDTYDSGGYLLHLSIELLLKSWLLSLTGEFSNTHRLQDLRQKISAAGAEIKLSKTQNKTIELIDRLFDLRYPNRQIPKEIGSEHFELAFQLHKALRVCLPNEVEQRYRATPLERKGGRVLMKKPRSVPTDIDVLLNKPAKQAKQRAKMTHAK